MRMLLPIQRVRLDLDRVGTRDNPLQGLSLDARLQPAIATGKVPVASIDGPDRYTFAARRVETPLESRVRPLCSMMWNSLVFLCSLSTAWRAFASIAARPA